MNFGNLGFLKGRYMKKLRRSHIVLVRFEYFGDKKGLDGTIANNGQNYYHNSSYEFPMIFLLFPLLEPLLEPLKWFWIAALWL